MAESTWVNEIDFTHELRYPLLMKYLHRAILWLANKEQIMGFVF